MSIEEQISELVDKYKGLDARRLKQFNEENTKKDFILPLFRHLGWDVTNSDEVAAEEKASNGRVDYAFKIGGVSKFYLEAKPLREDLNQRLDWAKQVITYAENKGVTWAVLTNFKQLMVFNAEWDEPTLERARFLNLTYREYLPAFHKLWWLSRDSVEKGVLNEEARQVGALKPKLPVEKSLLDQLLRWRKELFNQIYQHNRDRGLDFLQVDELIQQFINRLIFIRSTEDRGIEENRLHAALHQWRDSERKGELVEAMRAIFHEFATLYDSDLFPLLDAWDSLFVESDTIEKIIEGSYERPTRLAGYDFAAIDPDVLGAVYEQYLGYVAQVAREEAKKATQTRLLGFEAPAFELEARRIKRKQQGIYYTPKFVVDYIVKETVGRFIKEHSYNDIFNIKILDPACGSGSFLIRAYDELLHYHARQKGKSPAELDHWERLSILQRNIFGVDLDRQAVEITRLSLLLSCVAKREILPSLADNIHQGNSLISGADEELKKYFGDNWREKKPFNWEQEFKGIMANGGFDVVIGNPPYGSKKMLTNEEKAFVREHIKCTGSNDTAELFISRTAELLRDGGYHGFIVPKPFTYITSWQQIREFLITQSIESLVDVSRAFEEVLLEQVILIFRKQRPTKLAVSVAAVIGGEIEALGAVSRQFFDERIFPIYLTRSVEGLVQKLWSKSKQLSDITRIFAGIGGVTSKLTLDKSVAGKECLRGKNVDRYSYAERPVFLLPNGCFTQRDLDEHAQPRIVCQDIVAHIEHPQPHIKITATLDFTDRLTHETVINIALKPAEEGLPSLQYLLGLLNSKLISWYVYRCIFNSAIRTMHFRPGYADYVPIRRIDFNNPAEKKMHDDLVALVERMLELNKRLAPIRNTSFSERDELLREIDRTDAEIDQKVYELYGLTEKERQIIETSLASKSSSRSR